MSMNLLNYSICLITNLAGSSSRKWGREKGALNGCLSKGISLSYLQKQEVPWGRTINVKQKNTNHSMKQTGNKQRFGWII